MVIIFNISIKLHNSTLNNIRSVENLGFESYFFHSLFFFSGISIYQLSQVAFCRGFIMYLKIGNLYKNQHPYF